MTESLAERIATEALEWLGTPWHHNQSNKKVATDCVGLLVGVGKNVGFLPPDFQLENYNRVPRNDALMLLLNRYLTPVTRPVETGDILAFRKMGVTTHVGIYLGDYKFVHANNEYGVIQSYLKDYEKMLIAVFKAENG